MLANERIVRDLLSDLTSGDDKKLASAAKHVRDLCSSNKHYREAFVTHGCIPPLVNLVDGTDTKTCLLAIQALSHLVVDNEWRFLIRESGGLQRFVELVHKADTVPEATLETAILILHNFANDVNANDVKMRNDLGKAGLMEALVNLLQTDHCEEVLIAAITLLHYMAWSTDMQNNARTHGVLKVLLAKIQDPATPRAVVKVCFRALAVNIIGNTENQDAVRSLGGIPLILQQLQINPYDDTTVAAADVLRVVCHGNDSSKVEVRKEWGIPLLVLLLGPSIRSDIVEKAVDCLRILTTSNDGNRSSLMDCQAALPCLTRLLDDDVSEVIMEGVVAVIANITFSHDHFINLRESGIIQKLVKMLDKGPESKLTEMATLAIANLMHDPACRKALRISGGVPPLLQLMLESPTKHIQQAAEMALDKLAVTDLERNAILEAFRYAEQRHQRMNMVSLKIDVRDGDASTSSTSYDKHVGPKPLTRYTPVDVCALLRCLSMPEEALHIVSASALTGGELLELTSQDVLEDLGWSKLQAKKIRTVQSAFKLWQHVSSTPGAGVITYIELHKFLQKLNLVEEDVLAVVASFREHSAHPETGYVTFQDFVVSYHWLTRTLEALGEGASPSNGSMDEGSAPIAGSVIAS